jgi:hypothetical protein
MSRTRRQLAIASVTAVIALLPLVVPAATGSGRPAVVAGPERCC